MHSGDTRHTRHQSAGASFHPPTCSIMKGVQHAWHAKHSLITMHTAPPAAFEAARHCWQQ